MGELAPDLIPLPISQPSTLLKYQQDVRGAELQKMLAIRLPTYDLRDFEREIYVAESMAVGNGSTMRFQIAPGNELFTDPPFPRTRSTRVTTITVVNEAGASRIWLVRVNRIIAGGVIIQNIGRILLGASAEHQILGFPFVGFDGANAISVQGPGPVELYSNKPDGANADTLDIISEAGITNTNPVTVRATWEAIPDPVKYFDGSQALIGTP